jgi:hypothetical protein
MTDGPFGFISAVITRSRNANVTIERSTGLYEKLEEEVAGAATIIFSMRHSRRL